MKLSKLFPIVVVVLAIFLACVTWLYILSQHTTRDALRAQGRQIDNLEQRVGALEVQTGVFEKGLTGVEQNTSRLYQSSSQLANLQSQTQDSLQALSDELSDADIASLVAAWEPFVYKVVCSFDLSEGESTGKGSAVVERQGGEGRFLTNEHVLTQSGELPRECILEKPATGETVTVPGSDISVEDDVDLGYGRVASAVPALAASRRCQAPPSIGDAVLMLTYPAIGSDSSVTATEGIISGLEEAYYITSAKIDKGGSGGAAIHVTSDCLLGLPTVVAKGDVESLARILPLE